MVNQMLQDKVNYHRKMKRSYSEIRKQLEKEGYQRAEIEEALNAPIAYKAPEPYLNPQPAAQAEAHPGYTEQGAQDLQQQAANVQLQDIITAKPILAYIAIFMAFVWPMFGLILGIVALKGMKPGQQGRKLAVAAIIIGGVITLLTFIMPIAMMFMASPAIRFSPGAN
jgi:hypothetical protein